MGTSYTRIIVIINVGAFVLFNFLLYDYADSTFRIFSMLPVLFWEGYFWQPLTALFMHGSFMHILMNMVALWSIGEPIERDIGSRRFLKLYFISGLGSMLLVLILPGNPAIPTVGASGAVLGLLGAMAIFYPNAVLLLLFFPVRARTAAIFFGLISFIFAFAEPNSGISHSGHLGGLIAGLIYSRFIFQRPFFARSRGGGAPDITMDAVRDMFNDFRRRRRFTVIRGGRLYNPDSDDEPGRTTVDEKSGVNFQRPKKLRYDEQSGRFYFE